MNREEIKKVVELGEKATDTPWTYCAKLSGSENHKGFYVTDSGGWIADVSPRDQDGDEGECNARVITTYRTSAPLMAQMLLSIHKAIDLVDDSIKSAPSLRLTESDARQSAGFEMIMKILGR